MCEGPDILDGLVAFYDLRLLGRFSIIIILTLLSVAAATLCKVFSDNALMVVAATPVQRISSLESLRFDGVVYDDIDGSMMYFPADHSGC